MRALHQNLQRGVLLVQPLPIHRTGQTQTPSLDPSLQPSPPSPITQIQITSPIPPTPMPTSSLINNKSCPTYRGALHISAKHSTSGSFVRALAVLALCVAAIDGLRGSYEGFRLGSKVSSFSFHRSDFGGYLPLSDLIKFQQIAGRFAGPLHYAVFLSIAINSTSFFRVGYISSILRSIYFIENKNSIFFSNDAGVNCIE